MPTPNRTLTLLLLMGLLLARQSFLYSVVSADTDFDTCAARVGYAGKSLQSAELTQLTRHLEDPFLDGVVQANELSYLNEYQDITGNVHAEGDLEILIALQECLSGNSSSEFAVAPNVVEDTACEQLAREWPEQYRLSEEGIATLSGCRQDSRGKWFLPTGPGDPRLVGGPILTPDEERQTSQLRARIMEQLEGLTAAMPAWMKVEVDRFYSLEPHAGFGHLDPDAATMGFQEQYAEVFVSYLQNPNNVALANYAIWWGERRQAALGPACTDVPPMICDSFRLGLRTDWAPWPWDLTDPFTLAEYLDWALANGLVPPSSVSQQAGSATDCSGVAYWLGATGERIRTAQRAVGVGGIAPMPDPEMAATYRDSAEILRQLAIDQEQSAPPASVLAPNALLIQAFGAWADAFDLLAEAYESGEQATADAGWAKADEAGSYRDEAGRLIDEITVECGL